MYHITVSELYLSSYRVSLVEVEVLPTYYNGSMCLMVNKPARDLTTEHQYGSMRISL